MFNYMHYGKGYSDLSLRIGFVVQDNFWPNLTIFGSPKPTEERALYEWSVVLFLIASTVHNDDFFCNILDFWDILGYFRIFWDFWNFLRSRKYDATKGQSMSKCLLVSSFGPKNQRNFFQDFCPSLYKVV